MDLINTGTDSWILAHDACEKVAQEIMESLNARESESISSQSYDALSAKIRIRLKQYCAEVTELKRKLNSDSTNSTLTPEEKERRQRQVEFLQNKEVQLRELFNQRKEIDSKSSQNKSWSHMFDIKGRKSVFADMGTTSWADAERDYTTPENDSRTFDEMKEEQQRLLKEQDEGLESLLKIVTTQSQIARNINNEVEHHNEILVDIADGMDGLDGRINRATDMVKVIGKKESIWGYWLVAILLFIAILGVAFA